MAQPTPCNTRWQLLYNSSFEDGWNYWATVGYPLRTTALATQGSYSVLMGGYNNAGDGISQLAVLPTWADTAAVYFDWIMYSYEPSYALPYDGLGVSVVDYQTGVRLASGMIDNTATRGIWYTARLGIPNASAYRGRTLQVMLTAVTDAINPTGWYIDMARLMAGCGSSPAGEPGEQGIVSLPVEKVEGNKEPPAQPFQECRWRDYLPARGLILAGLAEGD